MTKSRSWRFSDADAQRYQDQYCSFRSNIVGKGAWAELWTGGRSTAVSLLPVLGVLGWGYSEVHVRRAKLATLAGLPEATVGRGLGLLQERGLIEHESRRGMVSFTLSRKRTLREDDSSRSGFRFSARNVFTGTWALLLPAQRSMYFALLSQMRYGNTGLHGGELWFDDHDQLRRLVSNADWRTMEELGVIQDALGSGIYLSRCIRISLNRVSSLTGVARKSVIRAVQDGAKLGRVAPFYRFRIAEDTVFHLPIRPPLWVNSTVMNGNARLRSLRDKQKHVRTLMTRQ